MIKVQRHREEIGLEPVGMAATKSQLGRDLTRHTEMIDGPQHLQPVGGAATSQMGRDLTRQTEPFGHAALEAYARQHGTSELSVVRMAVLYYLADREADRHAWRVPRFVRRRATRSASVEELLGALDPETVAAVEAEALNQGVSASILASHAVLYFLADADSGRLAGRLGETIDEEVED